MTRENASQILEDQGIFAHYAQRSAIGAKNNPSSRDHKLLCFSYSSVIMYWK